MTDKQVDMICRAIIAAGVIIADNRGDDMLDIGDEQKKQLLVSRVASIADAVFEGLPVS